MKNNEINKTISGSVISFVLSILLAAIAFGICGIYPGSEKTIFIFDMGGQYDAFFSYLHQLGKGYNSIFYQTFSGLGGSYFGTWAYYTASPLSLIVLLFDISDLPDAIYYLTILKLGLCALSFSLFIKHGHLHCKDNTVVVISSVLYALMSYNIVYSMCLMWLDGVIMLPVIILGADLIFDENRSELFIICMSLSIMFNYYISYMIIIFVVIYFLYYSFSYSFTLKSMINRSMIFLMGGFISLVLSAWILIPVFLDHKKGKLSEDAQAVSGLLRSPVSVLRQLFPHSYGGFLPSDNPSIYSGLLVSVFFVLYFFNRKISIRKKLCAGSVFAIFVLSFCTEFLDEMWHGFRVPNCFPARYAFLLSFFVLMIFAEMGILLGGGLKSHLKTVKYIVAAMCVIDVVLNSIYLINSLDNDEVTYKYLDRQDYDSFSAQNELILTSVGEGIFTTDFDYSSNDGLLFGLPSLDSFSSSYNLGISEFYRSIGMNSFYNTMKDQGLNPLSASMLGVEYYVKRNSGLTPTDVSLYFDSYKANDELILYKNPYSFGQYYFLDDCSIEIKPFGDDPFFNIDEFSRDASGVGDVFVNCIENIETVKNEVVTGGKYTKTITVKPIANGHLYFYVSAKDYFESEDYTNYDALYLGDNLIALYEDNGVRYMADLGVSDGSPLEFQFVTDSEDNEVYFYSFNDESYHEAVAKAITAGGARFIQSKECLEAHVFTDKDKELLLLLPYENGYNILIDGVKTDYEAYRNALIVVPVSAGDHTISISFMTPGFRLGVMISLLGILIFIIWSLIVLKVKTLNGKRFLT